MKLSLAVCCGLYQECLKIWLLLFSFIRITCKWATPAHVWQRISVKLLFFFFKYGQCITKCDCFIIKEIELVYRSKITKISLPTHRRSWMLIKLPTWQEK